MNDKQIKKYIKKLESFKKFEKKISPDTKFLLDHVSQDFCFYDGRFEHDEELLKRLGQMTITIGKLKYKLDQNIWEHRARKEHEIYINLWLQLRKYNKKYNEFLNRVYININIILLTRSSFKKYARANSFFNHLLENPTNHRQIILFAKDFKFKSNLKLKSYKQIEKEEMKAWKQSRKQSKNLD